MSYAPKTNVHVRLNREVTSILYVPTYFVCNVPRWEVDRNNKMRQILSHWCHRRCCHGNVLRDIKQRGRKWRGHGCHLLSQKGIKCVDVPSYFITSNGEVPENESVTIDVLRDRSLTSLWFSHWCLYGAIHIPPIFHFPRSNSVANQQRTSSCVWRICCIKFTLTDHGKHIKTMTNHK